MIINLEIAALIAAIVSIAIAGFAVWLSITFYRMSNEVSTGIKDASRGIASSVEKLEQLFNTFYSDTFSMVKDTFSDMRKHAWPDSDKKVDVESMIEEKMSPELDSLKTEMSTSISDIVAKIAKATDQIDDVKHGVEKVVGETIERTREIDKLASKSLEAHIRKEIILKIIRFKTTSPRPMKAMDIANTFMNTFAVDEVLKEIYTLNQEGSISIKGIINEPFDISPGSIIRVSKIQLRNLNIEVGEE